MELKKLFPLIVFINLDSRKDRLVESLEEFKKLNLNPTRVSAMTASIPSNPAAGAVMGCTLSHIHCLEMANEQNCNILIFEDDIKFVNEYEEIIEKACQQIQTLEWDMFYLGANILKPMTQVSPNLARLSHGQSTHAYGVNRKFVKTLLGGIPNNVVYPLDLLYTNYVIPKFNCYITAPKMVAVQRDSYSDIEKTQANYESYLEQRYYANFTPMP